MDSIRGAGLAELGHNVMLWRCTGMVFEAARSGFPIGRAPHDNALDKAARDGVLNALKVHIDDCEALDLTVSKAGLTRLAEMVRMDAQLTWRQLDGAAQAAFDTLRDELDTRLFLAVKAQRVRYYESPIEGWEQVLAAFPSVQVDVEEASKCFALNRFTAVVFHLMRIMEVGLRALGNTLNDESLDSTRNPTWDRILQRCRQEQTKPLAQRSGEWRTDEHFFSAASAHLMAVKDAWRNPTVHVEITYTEEAAVDVYNHVRAFMRHLATKLRES